MPRTAEIIAVGSELLTGGVTNTNAAFLSRLLTAAGVEVLYHTTVDDDAARLEKAVTIARGRAELLVFTGGLGPTYDDMTKTAVCAALDTPLVLHPEVVEDMRRYFDRVFRREMPECDMQQAYLPEGCTVFRNPVGTAPGCVFTAGKTTAALLPGVPHECRYMAEHCLLPWLEQVRGQTVRSHTLHIFGLTEPQVQELLDDLLRREADMTLAPYAKPGEVMLQLSARGADERACEARMAPVLAEVRARLGAYLYGVDVSGLEETVLTLCREALEQGRTPQEILSGGLIRGMNDLGEAFSANQAFVPEMLMAARCMTAALGELKPLMTGGNAKTVGRACIGTVRGDMHDIGKNLVKIMLEGSGVEVIDLGVDVTPEQFVETAKRQHCGVIACSSLLTTTMGEMRRVVTLAREAGIRDQVKIFVGGAPISQSFCDEIGADVYTEDAAAAARAAVSALKG